jgi:hypothetical protein
MEKNIYGNNTSSLFGILEGKAKARKDAAAADAAVKIEAAKQQTLLMEALAAKNGYDPKADAAQAAIDNTNAAASGDKTLYIILGLVVVAVMVGLYFIRRK